MTYEEQAKRTEARRSANPIREARRQSELTRMSTRTDLVPSYRDKRDERGNLESGRYLGHVTVRVGLAEGRSWQLVAVA